MSFTVLIAAAFLSTAALQSEPAPAAAAPAEEIKATKVPMPGTAYGDQVVCKSLKITGSRLGSRQKVCATRAEWATRSSDDQKDLEGIVRDSGKRPAKGL